MSHIGQAIVALVMLWTGAGEAAAQFKAPTVTLYIPSGIGGGYDTYGRLASRHLGRFLPGNPTLIDLGAARFVGERLDKKDVVVSIPYSPSDLMTGEPIDGRVDVY